MYKIPRYINKPLSFLGLELIEITLIYIAGFFAYLSSSAVYFIGAAVSVTWFIRAKRRGPQGFFKHTLYFANLYKLDRYPAFHEQEYLE